MIGGLRGMIFIDILEFHKRKIVTYAIVVQKTAGWISQSISLTSILPLLHLSVLPSIDSKCCCLRTTSAPSMP